MNPARQAESSGGGGGGGEFESESVVHFLGHGVGEAAAEYSGFAKDWNVRPCNRQDIERAVRSLLFDGLVVQASPPTAAEAAALSHSGGALSWGPPETVESLELVGRLQLASALGSAGGHDSSGGGGGSDWQASPPSPLEQALRAAKDGKAKDGKARKAGGGPGGGPGGEEEGVDLRLGSAYAGELLGLLGLAPGVKLSPGPSGLTSLGGEGGESEGGGAYRAIFESEESNQHREPCLMAMLAARQFARLYSACSADTTTAAPGETSESVAAALDLSPVCPEATEALQAKLKAGLQALLAATATASSLEPSAGGRAGLCASPLCAGVNAAAFRDAFVALAGAAVLPAAARADPAVAKAAAQMAVSRGVEVRHEAAAVHPLLRGVLEAAFPCEGGAAPGAIPGAFAPPGYFFLTAPPR